MLDYFVRWHRRIALRWTAFKEAILSDSYLHGLWPERRETSQHLTDENAKAPYVSLVVIASTDEYLRGCISWCSTIRPDSIILQVIEALREAEVNEFNMAFAIKQDIFRL